MLRWGTEAVCTLCDLQTADSFGLHLQCSLHLEESEYPQGLTQTRDQYSKGVGETPVMSHKRLASEVQGTDFTCNRSIYHGFLINSNFSNWKFAPIFVEMTFGWGQPSFRRPVQAPIRHEPFPPPNVRSQFEGVTWLSDNNCLSWEINGLHFLFSHFMQPAWITRSFNSKKRSWKHLLKAIQSSVGPLQDTFQNLLLLHLPLRRAGL